MNLFLMQYSDKILLHLVQVLFSVSIPINKNSDKAQADLIGIIIFIKFYLALYNIVIVILQQHLF